MFGVFGSLAVGCAVGGTFFLVIRKPTEAKVMYVVAAISGILELVI